MNTGNVVKGSSMSTASWKSGDAVTDQFPAGLRVLVVDDDPTCLMIVERMLKRCHYEVTTCNRAEKALASLQANRNGFDIVISDVHMPDMDGFKLLELIGLEMDLPVIMMSADDGKSVVMKGVTHGACDYLIKPIRIEELKNIWQHVIRKRKGGWKEMEQSASVDDGDHRQHNKQQHCEDAEDYTSSATEEGSWKNSKRRKDEEDELDDASGLKKPRVVWSIDLHQQFVAAVNQLGIDKAVPKKILELMNVPGLTRENVASHLQKYRLYLRRLSGVSQHHHGSFINPQDPTYGPMSSFSGLDLQQTLAVAGQLQPQSLASLQAAAGFGRRPSPKSAISIPLIIDQRNTFNIDNSNFKFGDPDRHVSKPMSLLHGIPTAMSAQSFDNNSMLKETHLLMQQTGESQSQHRSRAPQPNGSRFLMNHHGPELPGNSFPVLINPNLASKPRYQGEVSSSKGLTGGFISGFSDTQQIRSKEWDLQTVEAYLNHNNSSNIRGNLNGSQTVSSSSQRSGYVGNNNNKIKSEVVPDRIGLFQGHFGQEDLMSVFLKQQGGVGSVSNEFDFDGYSVDNIPV